MARPRTPLSQLADPDRAIARRQPVPEVPTGPPEPPPWLRPELVPEFRRRAEDLARAKHCDSRDGDALAILVTSSADVKECDRILAEQGRFVTSPRGGIVPHPAERSRDNALGRIVQAVRILGISPTTRGHVSRTTEEPAPLDPDSDEAFLASL